MKRKRRVVLMGNPNVGKSTVFNELTGSHQHTGNWTGKTVDIATGAYYYKYNDYELVDLPGTYSLIPSSQEERIAGDYLLGERYDCVVMVVDSTALLRNLSLVYQVLEITNKLVIMLNLTDEARKKNISIDAEIMSNMLGVPVVKATARSGRGINELLEQVHLICTDGEDYYRKTGVNLAKIDMPFIIEKAELVAEKCLTQAPSKRQKREEKLDRLLLGRYTSIPIMLLIFALVLWLTVAGSNYPSDLLQSLFNAFEQWLADTLLSLGVSGEIVSLTVGGVLRVLLWVVAVMLPPMAIFFPLFSLLEDFGILPRIAFNLDKPFECCNACGKQALTTCMGMGCNAVGVTGARIIDSPRERLAAIITNSITPCNGRFPLLIALISMFFARNSLEAALLLLCFLAFSFACTFLATKLLTSTVLKGLPSSMVLELPPFRKPHIGRLLADTFRERILLVLCRAAAASAPAGLVIWLLANISVNGASLLKTVSGFLEPIGSVMGLDGVILLAFLLGFPANEIVIPIALMCYLSGGELGSFSSLDELKAVLVANGWTVKTAICTGVFSLLHFPCSTTLLTIRHETKSLKWTLLSVAVPLSLGTAICVALNLLLP